MAILADITEIALFAFGHPIFDARTRFAFGASHHRRAPGLREKAWSTISILKKIPHKKRHRGKVKAAAS